MGEEQRLGVCSHLQKLSGSPASWSFGMLTQAGCVQQGFQRSNKGFLHQEAVGNP